MHDKKKINKTITTYYRELCNDAVEPNKYQTKYILESEL